MSTRSADTLLRPEGNSLQANYDSHDFAQAYVENRLDWYGLTVSQFGLDARENDEELTYSDKPDLAVSHDGVLGGYLELKSKSSRDWMNILNERHLSNYLDGGETFPGAANMDVPVYLVFVLLDEEDTVVRDERLFPVNSWSQVERTFQAPDMNEVVVLEENTSVRWGDMIGEITR